MNHHLLITTAMGSLCGLWTSEPGWLLLLIAIPAIKVQLFRITLSQYGWPSNCSVIFCPHSIIHELLILSRYLNILIYTLNQVNLMHLVILASSDLIFVLILLKQELRMATMLLDIVVSLLIPSIPANFT
jgi:hypothetical protein